MSNRKAHSNQRMATSRKSDFLRDWSQINQEYQATRLACSGCFEEQLRDLAISHCLAFSGLAAAPVPTRRTKVTALSCSSSCLRRGSPSSGANSKPPQLHLVRQRGSLTAAKNAALTELPPRESRLVGPKIGRRSSIPESPREARSRCLELGLPLLRLRVPPSAELRAAVGDHQDPRRSTLDRCSHQFNASVVRCCRQCSPVMTC